MALMQTHRQVVYRLLPQTRRNWQWLETTLEAQRQLYNAALEERIDFYRKTGKSRTYFDQCKALTQVPGGTSPKWRNARWAIQRGTLKRLDEAFKGVFFRRREGRRGAGVPAVQGKPRSSTASPSSPASRCRDGTLHVPVLRSR